MQLSRASSYALAGLVYTLRGLDWHIFRALELMDE